MIVLIWGVLGLVVGAFLNHLADRLPHHQALPVRPACRHCGRAYDLQQWWSPTALLTGRTCCRHCDAPLPRRRWLFEAGLAMLYGALAWWYPLSWTLVAATFHASALSLILVTDLEERKVPDAVVFPAMAFTLLHTGLTCPRCLPSALLGGAIGFLLFLLLTLLHMGLGDVMLAGYVGLIAGYPRVLLCLLVGILAGGVAAAALLLSGKVGRRSYIPYAPYLVLGGALALLYL
jgi:leader peptidase (prepilin peptidase)/N-methyltransferase